MLFVPVFMMNAGWAILSPAFSTPDEWAHVIKAAAVVRGQLLGRDIHLPGGVITEVRVPGVLGKSSAIPDCYSTHLDRTPSCAPALRGAKAITTVGTSAGRYPPLFYALIGWPSLMFPSLAGDYFMRLISAAIASALIVSALMSALEIRRSPLLAAGVFAAVTPMVLFLDGSPNPNGIEDAAAIALWAALIALLLEVDLPNPNRVLARAGVAAILLVHMRGLSPLWLAAIVATVAVAAPPAHLWRLVRRRAVQVWAAVVAVNAALAAVWIVATGSLDLAGVAPASKVPVIRTTIGKADWNVHQMIGVFGGLEHSAPAATYLIWFLVIGFLVLGAAAFGRGRGPMVVLGLTLATIVGPIVLEARQASQVGFVWQGRYTLPIAVGVPMLAGFVLGRDWNGDATVVRRAGAIVLGLVALGNGLAFAWTARRYTVGWNGPVLFPRHTRWEPPIPVAGLVPIFWLATGVVALFVGVAVHHRFDTEASAVSEAPAPAVAA